MRLLSYVFLLIVMLIGLTFAALNSVPVVFNYYLGAKTIALSLLLVLTFGAGILLGFIVAIFPWLKLKRDNRRFRARLKTAEQEVENLRSLPIKDE